MNRTCRWVLFPMLRTVLDNRRETEVGLVSRSFFISFQSPIYWSKTPYWWTSFVETWQVFQFFPRKFLVVDEPNIPFDTNIPTNNPFCNRKNFHLFCIFNMPIIKIPIIEIWDQKICVQILTSSIQIQMCAQLWLDGECGLNFTVVRPAGLTNGAISASPFKVKMIKKILVIPCLKRKNYNKQT